MSIDQHVGIQLRSPRPGTGWIRNFAQAPIPTRHEIWDHHLASIRVISTVELTEPARGVELHLSISRRGGRYPESWALEKVRKDFDAEDFELDDHGSKVAHLWCPLERDKRGPCPCTDEP